MKFRWVVWFCSLLCVGPPAQTANPEKATGLTVTGRVLQDPGGQPLRKVDVQLRSHELIKTGPQEDASESYSASTDAEGKFQIDNVKPGRYEATLERVGFVQSGKLGRFGKRLELKSSDDARDLILKMEAAAVITGRITDDDGDPLPSVNVQVSRTTRRGWDTHDNGWANTNDLGEYRIGGMRPGNYLVTATSPGRSRPAVAKDNNPSKVEQSYVTTYYPGTIDKTQAVRIELHPGDEAPASFLLLTSPTYTVRGTTEKPSGAKFVEIMLRSPASADMRQLPLVDGAFEFRGLLPGSYTAYLVTFDPSALTEVQQNRTPQAQVVRLSPDVEITNANLEGLHLVAQSLGQVRGRFRMDKGQKIDWTQLAVVLNPTDGAANFTSGNLGGGLSFAQVKSDGSFDLKTVAAGSYRLAITSSSSNLQDYFTKSVNLDAHDVADSGFTVSGGTSVLDVVISANGATVEGIVVDGKGHPVAGASVVGAPDGDARKRFDLFGQGSSDASGHFTLRGLNPGEYTVIAWEDPEENSRDPETVKLYEARGEKVQLEEGARKSVVVKVIPEDDSTP